MTTTDAARLLFDRTRASYEHRAANAVADLEEAVASANRRLAAEPGSLDRQLLASSANEILRAAALLHEAASALDALEHVSGAMPAPKEG